MAAIKFVKFRRPGRVLVELPRLSAPMRARTLRYPTIKHEALEVGCQFHANLLGPQNIHCVVCGTHVSRPNIQILTG
jgi:hypothetical protein